MASYENPIENVLRAGVTLENLAEAVQKSGYPLQTTVSALLRDDFSIQPEWGYRDRITGDMRALDIVARKRLGATDKDPPPVVTPYLTLLIECKQSDLPYIFFSDEKVVTTDFPLITGLKHERIEIKTDGDRSTYSYRIQSALGLDAADFVARPIGCSVLSKAARKGQRIELTGTEGYQGIVMPLMSAQHYFKQASAPPKTFAYFHADLTVPIAVLDAPMLTAAVSENGIALEYSPWERVIRHEPLPEDAPFAASGSTYAIDVVHRDFFLTYVSNHLGPFAEQFADAVFKHGTELARGKGFVPTMEDVSWRRNIEPHMTAG